MDKKRGLAVWLCDCVVVSGQEEEEKLAGSLRTRCGVMAWVIMFFCSAIETRVVFFLWDERCLLLGKGKLVRVLFRVLGGIW